MENQAIEGRKMAGDWRLKAEERNLRWWVETVKNAWKIGIETLDLTETDQEGWKENRNGMNDFD